MGTGHDVLLCAPALLIGGWLGAKLFHRVREDGIRKVIPMLFLRSGLSLVF